MKKCIKMKDPLFNKIKTFLKKNIDLKKPILLGYSGGFDSKTLFYLLLKLKEEINIDLHVAHVDHGWRKTSKKQAQMLKKEVEKKGIFFFI